MRLSIRSFVTLVVGLLVVPLATRPQPPARLPTVGFLGATTDSWGCLMFDCFAQ
jgi:hypothetical protein